MGRSTHCRCCILTSSSWCAFIYLQQRGPIQHTTAALRGIGWLCLTAFVIYPAMVEQGLSHTSPNCQVVCFPVLRDRTSRTFTILQVESHPLNVSGCPYITRTFQHYQVATHSLSATKAAPSITSLSCNTFPHPRLGLPELKLHTPNNNTPEPGPTIKIRKMTRTSHDRQTHNMLTCDVPVKNANDHKNPTQQDNNDQRTACRALYSW